MIRKIFTFPLIALIYIYRYAISPLTPASCRHLPTCSEYAVEALKKHGLLKGSWLAVRRISKCHPWGSSGFDPVPEEYKVKFRIKNIHMPLKKNKN